MSRGPPRFAVILTAGRSRRMGFPKAFLQYAAGPPRETFFDRAVQLASLECRPQRVVAVRSPDLAFEGRRPELLWPALSWTVNPAPERGMFSSLQLGARAARGRAGGPLRLMVLLVDHPLVRQETVRKLWRQSDLMPERVIVPVFEGRSGHPVVLCADLVDVLIEAPVESRLDRLIGLEEGSAQHEDPAHGPDGGWAIERVAVADPGVVENINTRARYDRYFGRPSD